MLLVLAILTGHFQHILIFSTLILIHELGHFICAVCLGWKVVAIHLYPYGGCCEFNEEINVRLWQEWLVLVMGPLTQILFVFLLSFILDPRDLVLYQHYSYFLLLFNLLPIYPLDGGRFLLLFFHRFLSFYYSYQFVLFLSYFLLFTMLLASLFFFHNLIFFLSLLLLFIKLCQEIQQFTFYYQKFLLERYLHHYLFKRKKQISNLKQMKRDTYHYFVENGSIISEFEYLRQLFSH